MPNSLVLLPGWGLGVAALTPLAAALQDVLPEWRILLEPLPALDSSAVEDWLADLDQRLPSDAWLGGWSLGGMLATQLAARRGARCPGLLTLASNLCFVATTQWPSAMPEQTFATFQSNCAADSAATLKRFAMLCAQGTPDARAVGRRLAASACVASPAQLLAGLEILARLDGRPAVENFTGPQWHFFAAEDALVPVAAAHALRDAQPRAHVHVVETASHAFVQERPVELAARLAACLVEVAHG